MKEKLNYIFFIDGLIIFKNKPKSYNKILFELKYGKII